MRHRKKVRKFKRTKEQKKALFNGLVSSLVEKEKIITTEARAKELRRIAEKIITKSKKDNLSNRRLLLRNLSEQVVKKLFKEIGPRYKNRSGGYTRIIKINPRTQDAAKMAVIELIK